MLPNEMVGGRTKSERNGCTHAAHNADKEVKITMANLPSYIKQRSPDAPSLAQRGLQNVGVGAGPHVSLSGDRFTLVDAAGGKQPIQTLYFDVCILDINDHLSKMYYDPETPYDPNNTQPPLCWSDNGVAPSIQVPANTVQSTICANCPQNVWGSKISNLGSEVKACRDEQKVAVLVPGMPNNLFRLTIPPNSLKDWRAYLVKFQNAGFDVYDVVTRLTILPEGKKLQFSPAPNPWLDEGTVQARDKALAAKASDMIVGRLDRPRQGALPAPQQEVQPVRPLPAPAQTAAFPSTATAPPPTQTAHPAPAASPSEAPKRRRRTQAEIAADNTKAGAPTPAAAAPASGQGGQATMAPFRPEAQNGAAPTGNGPPFGVGAGVAPDPALTKALGDIFGN